VLRVPPFKSQVGLQDSMLGSSKPS